MASSLSSFPANPATFASVLLFTLAEESSMVKFFPDRSSFKSNIKIQTLNLCSILLGHFKCKKKNVSLFFNRGITDIENQ